MRREKFLVGLLVCVCIALLVDILANTVWNFSTEAISGRGAVVDIISATNQNMGDTEVDEDDDYYKPVFEHTFEIQNEWDNHYDAEMTLKNTGDKVLEDWEVAFMFDGEIENIWNARMVSHYDDIYIIKNDGKNKDIKAGHTAAFGFTVQYGEKKPQEPYNLSMEKFWGDADDCDVKLKQVTTKEGGILGQITIKNESEQTIEGWRYYFEGNFEIVNSWGARADEEQRDTDCVSYYMYNGDLHQDIKPGEIITIRFTGRLLEVEDEEGEIIDDFLEQFTVAPYDEEDEVDDDDCIWEGDEYENDTMPVVDDEVLDEDDYDRMESD